MKILCLMLILLINNAFALEYTKSYFKKDGAFLSGHYKTNKNHTKLDNFSTKGNYNYFTGKKGYKSPYNLNPTRIKSTPYNFKTFKTPSIKRNF